MFTRNRVNTHESGTSGRNKPSRSQRPRCVCHPDRMGRGGLSKEPHPPEVFPVDGVSTYLALTFGTLLSSQGTDASFVPVSSGSPGASLRSCVSDSIRSLRARFSPVRFRLSASSRFRLYQIRFRSVSGSNSFRFPVGGGCLSADPTLSDCSGPEFRPASRDAPYAQRAALPVQAEP